MTDPEDTVDVMPDELAEHAADLTDEFERPLPEEAEPADAVEQRRDVPDDGRDEVPE
jgi:hypothetical protein